MLCWLQQELAPEQLVSDEGEFDNLEFESEKEELPPGQGYTEENQVMKDQPSPLYHQLIT